MTRYAFAVLFIVVNAAVGSAHAEDVPAVIARSEALIAEEQFDAAINILKASQDETPDHYARDFLLVRARAWSGDHAGALEELKALEAEFGENSDTMNFRGHILRYQGRREAAKAQFHTVLAAYPDNAEAQNALENYFPPPAPPSPPSGDTQTPPERTGGAPRWRVHTGAQVSTFQRRDTSNWNQQYFSAGYGFPERRMGVHGAVRRYERFSFEDYEFETGLSAAPSANSSVYVALSATPNANFRPEWRINGGGAVRIAKEPTLFKNGVWLTADMRYDWYDGVEIFTGNPGVRFAFNDYWRVRSRMISVAEIDGRTTFGWDARLDGRFHDGWRFFTGLADAPETVAAETVRTFSIFGGLSIDLTDRLSLNVAYTRNDREDSYIREVWHAGVGARF